MQILQKNMLFSNIDLDSIDKLLGCLDGRKESFGKGETMLGVGQPVKRFGILLGGSAQVEQHDFWGNRTLLTHLEPADMFAEAFCCVGVLASPVSVVALRQSEVLWLSYQRMMGNCRESCWYHDQLIQNMMKVLAGKNIQLTRKIEHMGKRSTREKLLSYLSDQAREAGRNDFVIPFDRQQLADYLNVERSAMSSVLGQLKGEGVLDFQKNRFKLLSDQEQKTG